MAYDPEARETSNSAMIISIVAVVLIVLGALAWYATRPADLQPTNIITNNQPAPIVGPTAAPAPGTIIVTPPATNPAPAPAPAPNVNSDTHVTVEQPANTTPPPAKNPAPAGDETSSTTTTTTTTPGDSKTTMDKSTGKSEDKSGTAATPPRY